MISQDELRRVMFYDPNTGRLTWKIKKKRANPGSEVGWLANGHRRFRYKGRAYFAHRAVWCYVTGHWPDHEIDHRNGVRDDNRWSNLRLATRRENALNQAVRKNLTGFRGVYPAAGGRFIAQFKRKHLGSFGSPEEAYSAYLCARSVDATFQPIPREKQS